MSKDDNECKRGALAIERQIDRQLEFLNVPIPSRSWLIDVDRKFTADIEITYQCSGKKITAIFRADEIRTYRRQPLPETVLKIEAIAAEMRDAYEKREK